MRTPATHGRGFLPAAPRPNSAPMPRSACGGSLSPAGPRRRSRARSVANTPAHLSTQQAFGRFFADLRRAASEVAERVVTTSPDVASSTNLGGWINQAGVWNPTDRPDWFADDTDTLVHWREGRRGQHIELGIAEVNMVGLLGELGATWSRDGQPLLPIGTIYDPFIGRALEPWSFGIYAGGQSILVGTPSGVSLAPEGGAHQSLITPSIGIEQPLCTAWEPAFGQDLEWTLLAALGRLGRPDGGSAYFRLSTRPIDQSLASLPADPEAREHRRREALAGGYLLRAAAGPPEVTIVAVGVTVPEACEAAEELGAARDRRRRRLPDLARPRLSRAEGPAGAGRGRAGGSRRPLPGRAGGADRLGPRRPSPRPLLPLGDPRSPDLRRSGWITSANRAMSATSTATSASTSTRSSGPQRTSSTEAALLRSKPISRNGTEACAGC